MIDADPGAFRMSSVLLYRSKEQTLPQLEKQLEQRGQLEVLKMRYSDDLREGNYLKTETVATNEQVKYYYT